MDYQETEKFLNIFFPTDLTNIMFGYCKYEIVEYKPNIKSKNIYTNLNNIPLFIYAMNYNILKIQSGISSGLMFSE